MAVLVHIAPEKAARRIARAGIKPARRLGTEAAGIYCMPVLQSHTVSHQWLRELKRRGQRTLVGVYFRLRSDERVAVGRFNQTAEEMPLGRAIGLIMNSADPLGWQIIVPRAIASGEVLAVRRVSQRLGWRYFPGAHGRRPCPYPCCLEKGEIKSRRIRARA